MEEDRQEGGKDNVGWLERGVGLEFLTLLGVEGIEEAFLGLVF